ncbi:MAG: cytochrome ubiquinol oxidase subunit I [Bdellovibrionales bacterium]|nr:cytochrome ubiquinol oxidase subunit I [Bdellovibrionales bacterium]
MAAHVQRLWPGGNVDELLAARLQMAISLGFHIVFACIGMVMPFLMAAAHWCWLKTNDRVWLELTKAWSRGVAIFFAVGAVSGTLLSFELGLLWPKFMEHAGPIFGLPFSWEGAAFFLEAIFLGMFLYGWNQLPRWLHWTTGVLVGLSGLASGILVVAANGWMNAPSGFRYENGVFFDIDPVAAMLNDAWFTQALHMTLAAFAATGFGVAGLHAALLLRHPGHPLHQKAIRVALPFAATAALLQPLSGDLSAKDIAERQPLKLAAAEALFETTRGAPLLIGGIPDMELREVHYAIELPYLLSFLAHSSFQAEVLGLDAFPEDEWPPVPLVHYAFQVMVGIGFVLAGLGAYYWYMAVRGRPFLDRFWFLAALSASAPLGFIAVEAGWIVTEVGRQPWIIYGVMKTADSLTEMPGIQYSLAFYVFAYLLLALLVAWLMKRQIAALESQLRVYP